MPQLTLNTPVEDLFMVGPNYARKLKKLNLHTVADLLHHYPSRYQDLGLVTPIAQAQPNHTITIHGQVVSCSNAFTKWRLFGRFYL